MDSCTTITLLRHGQCLGGKIFRGHSDVSLSEQGWAAMDNSFKHLKHSPEFVISSPLRRSLDWATKLANRHTLPLKTDSRFQEIDFGDWDGKLIEDLWEDKNSGVHGWYENPVSAQIPNGEALEDFDKRVTQGLLEICSKHEGEHVLLVTHAGIIRAAMAQILGMPLHKLHDIFVPYACLSQLRAYTFNNKLTLQLQSHNIANSES
ncbi:MAG: alpha-ribazole phosphatase [Flavobacteriales bacterium]|jgi:alpha-ribazole phosphatase